METNKADSITVIMPAYNAEKTIGEAVKSVIAQTVTDWELIVIDDGSTDNTATILTELASADSRIRFLQNEKNSGVSFTRNRAVELADGKWIAFLDSDDKWLPEKLEKQLGLLKKYPEMVVCYTASSFIDNNGKPFKYVMEAIERLDYKTLLSKNIMSCSSVMIRSDVMKLVKMPNDAMHEDYYVWLTVLREHKFAYGINEPLLIYRLCPNSKSASRIKSAKMLFNSYRAIGCNLFKTIVLVLRYTLYSIKKRRRIYNSKG
ncbi:MAG: glycosyltransferase family 2 protein [Ruminococcaceae bacterium]|nr:glycosyltransferase family 2 protein [Oscillospiraceae bacterium]